MPRKYLPRENPELFEINTAAWLYSLSRKLGKPVRLGEIPSVEWDRLKSAGMDFVWLMGVWSRSQMGRNVSLTDPGFHKVFDNITPGWTPEDVIGSSYSISAYEPDPLVGTWDDIDFTRKELHQRGMGLILDFIPNHTGIDHHWITQHPDYYVLVQKEDYEKDPAAYFPISHDGRILYIAHGRDPNFPSWTDTAQLNYFNPQTREAVIQIIEKISQHCDGIRCDMAMLVLNEVLQRVWGWANKYPAHALPAEEFWKQAIQRVPNLVYIAEAYWDTEWTLQQLGFDFVYDKRLYDRLRSGHPHDVYLHLKADMDYQKKLARFIENHDELRSVVAFGRGKVKAAATLFSTVPGMKLYFQGQREGRQIRLPVQIRRTRLEPADQELKSFYEKLWATVNREVFHSGVWQLREIFPDTDGTAENLVGYTWKLEKQIFLVVVNLNQHPARGIICLADDVLESKDYFFTDMFNRVRTVQPGKVLAYPGFYLNMDGYQARILEIIPVE
jgi:glycosidase